MSFLTPKQKPSERFEPQIRSVWMTQRQQVLGVQIASVSQKRVHVASQETTLKICLMSDQGAPRKQVPNLLAGSESCAGRLRHLHRSDR